MGLDIAAQLRTTLKISNEPNYTNLVEKIGKRLSKRLKNKNLKFSFKVYSDPSPNAFAVPGGFVFISTSLLELYELDEDMTAFVAAHEMGHIIRRHSINRLINAAAVTTITRALPAKGQIAMVLKSTGIKFFQSAYSQSQELEADTFAIKLVKAAGYKPKKSIPALEKLAKSHKSPSTPADEYFSTHPPTARRIENIAANI